MQSSPKHNPVPTEQRENHADANPNRPLTGERVRKDLPGNMCLRHFVLAPKASFETSGKWSSLPFVVVIYSNFPPQIPNTRLYHTGQNCNIDILPTKHCDFHHFFAVFLPSKGPNTRSIPVLVTNQVLPDFLASVGFMRGGILPYPLHACCTVIGAFPHNAAASDADITSSNAFSLKSS